MTGTRRAVPDGRPRPGEHVHARRVAHGGRFLVHGGWDATAVEGELPGDIVIIAFPDRRRAEGWYASDAYQRILPLRTEHADCAAFLVDGVPDGYRAASFVEKITAGAEVRLEPPGRGAGAARSRDLRRDQQGTSLV